MLRVLEQHPEYSQRQIAQSVGLSLGAINYCIRRLVEKGYVKVDNFWKSDAKKDYIYVLTPNGIAVRAALTARFLQRKVAEYEALKAEIDTLRQEMQSASSERGRDRCEPAGRMRRQEKSADRRGGSAVSANWRGWPWES